MQVYIQDTRTTLKSWYKRARLSVDSATIKLYHALKVSSVKRLIPVILLKKSYVLEMETPWETCTALIQ